MVCLSPTKGASVRPLAACLLAILLLSGCGSGRFDGERALRLLERQCEFGPRFPGSVGHEEAEEWLTSSLADLADELAVQRFVAQSATGDVVLTNIIASFEPDRRERVLLAAHWDTRAVAEKDPDPASRKTPILGANDGASGVAVLLELARLLVDDPPAVGVDIVLFDGEDGGGAGGRAGWGRGSTY
jgi:glutaminyl-peptide cyclotransferase